MNDENLINEEKNLLLFSEATQISTCVFTENELLFQAEAGRWDHNLPLYLVSSLPSSLPDLWYAVTPEDLIFGGLLLPDTKDSSQNAGSSVAADSRVPPRRLLLLGPVLPDRCTRKQAGSIISRLGLKQSETDLFLRHSERHPVLSVLQLSAHLKFLFRFFYPREAWEKCPENVTMIDFQWRTFFPDRNPMLHEQEKKAADNTAGKDVNEVDDGGMEIQILNMLAHGRTHDLRLFFNEAPVYHQPALEEATRNFELRRSYLIGANMLASRTAIQAGADPSVIQSLTSSYLEELLKATRLNELAPIFQNFMLEYTGEVEKLLKFPFHDIVCLRIHRYVTTHLYEPLSTSLIAQSLRLSAPYISKHFREVTGATITDHIAQQKIKEAAYLIDTRRYTFGEISSLLQFSSQSYFIKIFKKYMDMTPEEYRQYRK